MVNSDFWSGKRVLVTGHTGFKGAWLCIWLRELGALVSGFSLEPTTSPALYDLAKLGEAITSHIGDIRSEAAIRQVIRTAKPEILIHMAAQPLVQASYADPVTTYATNVMGTVHVLEAAREVESVKVVINVTSDKCYENREWVWAYRESDDIGGYDPYSSSKGCAELVTSAYRRSFLTDAGIALASARSGNVIGGGDWSAGRIVPDLLRAVETGESIDVRNPEAIRPWQHVLEPLAGYLILAQKLLEDESRYADAWNFGPSEDNAIPVRELARRLLNLLESEAGWNNTSQASPHESQLLRLDISKARQGLGWEPLWSIDDTLEKVAEWHRGWRSKVDIESLCIEQIDAYQNQVASRAHRQNLMGGG
jgi:CDP-glucose 4,6-dehydratase